jgi:hypothetical protein
MHDLSVRRRTMVLVGLTATAWLVACGEDKRVKQLEAGITRDSAVSIISHDLRSGSGPDSFPNVYTRERYIIAGKSHEVLFFTPNNEKQGKDSVTYGKLTPIVFVDNRLVAKGWPAWDSISKANNIPLKDHSK